MRKGEAEAATPASSLRTTNYEPRTFLAAIDRLIGHPLNANRMPPALLAKLEANIGDSGRYPPLIVRTLHASPQAADWGEGTLQVIDGHHRLEVLRRLGHKLVRVDCWGDLTDAETELLLATLNRLEGSDDAERRAGLIESLRSGAGLDNDRLAALLPESADALAALQRLADPPPLPETAEPMLVPVTVFVTPAQRQIVRRAIQHARNGEHEDANGTAWTRICEHYLERNARNQEADEKTPAEREVGTIRTGRRRRHIHATRAGQDIPTEPDTDQPHPPRREPAAGRAADSRDPRAHSPVVPAPAGQSLAAGGSNAGDAVDA